jgi:hypothetical protein
VAPAWTSWAWPPVTRTRQIDGLGEPDGELRSAGYLTKYTQPSRMLSTASLALSGCGVSQRSRSPVREDSKAIRSPSAGSAVAGKNDAANTGGTVLAVLAPVLEVAATGWTGAGPEADVPPAHPAASAATVMARAAAMPRRAFLTNLTFL